MPTSAVRAVLGLVAVLLLGGCTRPEVACTELASPPGVSVVVDREAAHGVTRLTLTVCASGSCRDHPVPLAAGSDTIDQGCDGTDPDAACSATASPNGTLVGFAPVEDLPAGPVEVGARITRSGRTTTLPRIGLVAAPTFPNGPACPVGGNQAALRVTTGGLRAGR